MEIEFEFEINDWMEFQKNYLQNSKQFRRTKIIVMAMLPVIFSVIILLESLKGNFSLFGLIVYGIASVLWIIFYPKRMYKQALSKTRKMIDEGDNTGILGLHKLIFNDEGIIHIEPESEQKIIFTRLQIM